MGEWFKGALYQAMETIGSHLVVCDVTLNSP
jgi:hypothetical protein